MEVCIVYLSSSVGLFEPDDLSIILQQSHRNNAESGVTGIILYVRGRIIQVLEGQKEVVEALYQRIEKDPRHMDVRMVLNRPITQRLFGNWTMGYETINASQLDTIRNIVNPADSEGNTNELQSNIILKTIKVFYESNRYN